MSFGKYHKKKFKTNDLKSMLDKAFSDFIRLSNADAAGYCTCCTCGAKKHWKETDAGHFIHRNHTSVRYDERNVHPQCQRCNRWLSGMQYEHSLHVDNMHGEGTAEELRRLSYTQTKFNDFFYIAQIEKYREKVNLLKKAIL